MEGRPGRSRQGGERRREGGMRKGQGWTLKVRAQRGSDGWRFRWRRRRRRVAGTGTSTGKEENAELEEGGGGGGSRAGRWEEPRRTRALRAEPATAPSPSSGDRPALFFPRDADDYGYPRTGSCLGREPPQIWDLEVFPIGPDLSPALHEKNKREGAVTVAERGGGGGQ